MALRKRASATTPYQRRKSKMFNIGLFPVILVVVLLVIYNFISDNFGKDKNDVDITNRDVSVHFIDVGQGDCTLIHAYGKNILIDSGEREKADDVLNYLDDLNIKKIDYLIGTHPHSDHIGGFEKIINNMEIETVIFPELYDNIPTTKTYSNLMQTIIDKEIPVRAAIPSDIYNMGTAKFTILAPVANYSDLNNMSILVKFESDDFSVLVGGDMEEEAETDVLAKNYDLKSTIFKVSHHGSKTSTTQEFLDAVDADYYVICVGENNTYGHPDNDVLDRLTKKNKPVYTTSDSGTIIFFPDNGIVEIVIEKEL